MYNSEVFLHFWRDEGIRPYQAVEIKKSRKENFYFDIFLVLNIFKKYFDPAIFALEIWGTWQIC